MTRLRRSDAFLLALGAAAVLGVGAGAHAIRARRAASAELEAQAVLVGRLGLTDLCLFTEARYTRHPSQADRFTPFQDHPGAREHFPSGSLVAPPP